MNKFLRNVILLVLLVIICINYTSCRQYKLTSDHEEMALDEDPQPEKVDPDKEELEKIKAAAKRIIQKRMGMMHTGTTAPQKQKRQGPYLLRVGDMLEISVLGRSDMTRDVTVIPDGTITYLLVGELQAKGKTIPQLKKEITEALKKLDKSPEVVEELKEGPYRLRIGDVLEISVLDEPEMTREVTVIPGGTINYLLIGEIPAVGKTIQELKNEISKALEKFYVNPEVSVLTRKIIETQVVEQSVFKNPQVSIIMKKLQDEIEDPIYASIIGAVKSPGKYELEEGDRLLDVIADASGFLFIVDDDLGGRTIANLNSSYISRNGKKLDVNFDRLVRLGDMSQNIVLQDHDFIYIASSDTDPIFVIGEVEESRPIPYDRDDITLAEAIARGGGFTRKAQRSKIIVLRNTVDGMKSLEVDMEALLLGDPQEKNLKLKGGDIVFIPEQGMSKYARYTEYLMVFADALLKGYQVREAVRFPKLKRDD